LHRGNRPLEPSGRDIGGEDEPGSNGGGGGASNQKEEDDSNEEQQGTRSARNGRDPKHCEQETRRPSHMQTAHSEKEVEAASPLPSHHSAIDLRGPAQQQGRERSPDVSIKRRSPRTRRRELVEEPTIEERDTRQPGRTFAFEPQRALDRDAVHRPGNRNV